MKVFLATLFFVGFAAAVPCPVLKRLKNALQKDVEILEDVTEMMIQIKGPSIEDAIATFAHNPSTGSDALKELLSDVARTAFFNNTYTLLQMDRDIKRSVEALQELPRKLVKNAVYPILDDLKGQNIRNVMVDRAGVLNLLEVTRQLFAVKTIAYVPPALASEIQKKLNAEWLKFVQERRQYVKKTEQLVQDTMKRIERLYQL